MELRHFLFALKRTNKKGCHDLYQPLHESPWRGKLKFYTMILTILQLPAGQSRIKIQTLGSFLYLFFFLYREKKRIN